MLVRDLLVGAEITTRYGKKLQIISGTKYRQKMGIWSWVQMALFARRPVRKLGIHGQYGTIPAWSRVEKIELGSGSAWREAE